jgi:hypothetical protein
MKNRSGIKCLKIDDEWARLILSGEKTWEIRRANTRFRGRIGLGNTKTKRCVGYARIIDSFEMPVQELKKNNDKHRANTFLDQYAKGRQTLFVYVLSDVEAEPKPKP